MKFKPCFPRIAKAVWKILGYLQYNSKAHSFKYNSNFIFVVLLRLFFWNRLSLYSPEQPEAHSIDQASLDSQIPACFCLLSAGREYIHHHSAQNPVFSQNVPFIISVGLQDPEFRERKDMVCLGLRLWVTESSLGSGHVDSQRRNSSWLARSSDLVL